MELTENKTLFTPNEFIPEKEVNNSNYIAEGEKPVLVEAVGKVKK